MLVLCFYFITGRNWLVYIIYIIECMTSIIEQVFYK